MIYGTIKIINSVLYHIQMPGATDKQVFCDAMSRHCYWRWTWSLGVPGETFSSLQTDRTRAFRYMKEAVAQQQRRLLDGVFRCRYDA